MNERLKNFLEEKRKQAQEAKQQEIKTFLRKNGLEERVYPSTKQTSWSEEYPLFDSEQRCYYKFEPFDITLEEYEELKKYASQASQESEVKSPTVATTLYVIGMLTYVFGLFAGFSLPFLLNLNFIVTLSLWLSSFISGTVFLGFAKVIELLYSINRKIK